MTQNESTEQLIDWFDDFGDEPVNRHRWLSNFYDEGAPFALPGVTWERVLDVHEWYDHPGVETVLLYLGFVETPAGDVYFKTGEHAYAAMKVWGTNPLWFIDMVLADGPGDVKSTGRKHNAQREDWESVKLDVMAAVVRSKFTLERHEGRMLVLTGDALLVEGTYWEDDVWGVDLKGRVRTQEASGRNWLGTLLMARRAELRAEQQFGVTTRAVESNAVSARGWVPPAWKQLGY